MVVSTLKRNRRFNMVFFEREYKILKWNAIKCNLTISEYIREAIRMKNYQTDGRIEWNNIKKKENNNEEIVCDGRFPHRKPKLQKGFVSWDSE